MSLTRVPHLRKASIISVLGSVVFLMLAASFPEQRVTLAVLAITIVFLPYYFFTLWLRKGGGQRRIPRDIWVRELTPEKAGEWLASGRITQEEYEKMMRSLESR